MVFEEDGGVVLLVMEEVKLGRSLGESSPATRCRRWWPVMGSVLSWRRRRRKEMRRGEEEKKEKERKKKKEVMEMGWMGEGIK